MLEQRRHNNYQTLFSFDTDLIAQRITSLHIVLHQTKHFLVVKCLVGGEKEKKKKKNHTRTESLPLQDSP